MVGPGRLELPTPRLSSVCSNQLSYGPIAYIEQMPDIVAHERNPMVRYLLEERETWTAQSAIPSDAEAFRGVLRFDGRLTGAIYVLKSTGRFISRDKSETCRRIVLPVPQLP